MFLLCVKFQIIILKTVGEVAEQQTLQCYVYNIMKTRLYNFDTLKPHFSIVKLVFLILL